MAHLVVWFINSSISQQFFNVFFRNLVNTLYMFVEISLLREYFLAHETFKRSFTCVHSHMINDITLLSEDSVASLVSAKQLLNDSVCIFTFLKSYWVFPYFLKKSFVLWFFLLAIFIVIVLINFFWFCIIFDTFHIFILLI